MASLRVSEETHAKLKEVARELSMELGRTVSTDEVLERLINRHGLEPSDFQGAWDMTDKEARELFSTVRKRW